MNHSFWLERPVSGDATGRADAARWGNCGEYCGIRSGPDIDKSAGRDECVPLLDVNGVEVTLGKIGNSRG